MISNLKVIFLYLIYSPIILYLCSYLDLIDNPEIINKDTNEASEASESRDMWSSTLPSNKDMLPKSLFNMNSVLEHYHCKAPEA